MNYSNFLSAKKVTAPTLGFDVDPDEIHPVLFPFQRDIVRWTLKRGRFAVFAECGLGKTLMELEYARQVVNYTGRKVIIFVPLAVAHQTVKEAEKLSLPVQYARSQEFADQCAAKVIVANYEMLEHFNLDAFAAVLLDESSILKAFTGKTKRLLIEKCANVPYRGCYTATPAPNDHLEFGNHSEFLGVMESNRMISRWFINDTMKAGSYRLKGHAERDYWRWMTSWAVCISKPSDLGPQFSDEGYVLPDLNVYTHNVSVDHSRAWDKGQLFLMEKPSATRMWEDKRATLVDRTEMVKEIADDGTWVLWCDTNDEADALQKLFPDAVEVRGSHSIKEKERRLSMFSDGSANKIITKPDIAGFGLNWQHCHKHAFVGLTYSFEKIYQASRRSWRFGQQHPVNLHMVYAETEGNILKTFQEKQALHLEMQRKMTAAQRENGLDGILKGNAKQVEYQPQVKMKLPSFLGANQ